MTERIQGFEPDDTISAMDFNTFMQPENEWDYEDFYPAPLSNVIEVNFIKEDLPDIAA